MLDILDLLRKKNEHNSKKNDGSSVCLELIFDLHNVIG